MKDIIGYFDRNTIISIIVTSIILGFLNYKILILYAMGLMAIIILKFKWNIITVKTINSSLINLMVTVATVFALIVVMEIWLHLFPHLFTNIDRVDTVGEFSDYTLRGYLTEDVLKRRPDTIRILGLGDSFSVFLSKEGKNYHNFLQEKLIAAGRGDVEIVNAGMEATGPGYYGHMLSKYGPLFNPDLVLVGFFVGNDFEEAEFTIFIGNIINEPKDLIKRYSKYYQFNKWRLYKFIKNKYNRYEDEQLKRQEIELHPKQQVGSFSQENFLYIEKKRSWIFDKNNRDRLEMKWRECADVLLNMKDWCDRRKIKLVINILPDQFQVDPKLRAQVYTDYKEIAEKNIDLGQPDRVIVNFCREHDIHCLDLLGPFQEQGKTRELYALRDTHWNEAGNRLAADLIFKYLEENHLVPSRPRQ